MPLRSRSDLLFGITLLLTITAIAVCGATLVQIPVAGENTVSILHKILLTLLLITAIIIAIHWQNFRQTLIKPLRSVTRGAEIILNTHAAHELEISSTQHQLGQLPDIIHQLGDEMVNSRLQISRALKTGAEKAYNQKTYLEQVIRGLDEGVVVCDLNARILLYNPSSVRILQCPERIGLGRSIYAVLPRSPIEHTLSVIGAKSQSALPTDFICSVLDKEHMLHCRMGLLSNDDDLLDPHGFVMTFYDVTSRQGALRKRNELLRHTVEELRSPLASLRAAAENVVTHKDMPEKMQIAFHSVILSESETLSRQVDTLADESRKLLGGELVTADIFSPDLIRNIGQREKSVQEIRITQTGLPLWIRVDSHAMAVLLEFYMLKIKALTGVSDYDIEADHRDHKVYLDISWQGSPISYKQLTEWESETLADVVGFPTVDKVLQQHNSVIWSQKHPRIQGNSILRIPIPGSERQWEQVTENIPSRPISYDFNLAEMAGDDSNLKARRLRELNFVVFDTETTGLNPEQGDEIISIAGVRVVNQRILPDEAFDQLVDPNRTIPKASIRYHGITDEQVKGKPTIDQVLPQFKSFVGDSVLVAHNAWFDLRFLKRREMQSGVRFRNPVLDTLMLSVCLHGHEVDQSLDAIVDRLGIEILKRHTALADSLATAELLLRLIDLLETQGIVTLQDALNAYK